jgi:hypothetical protein
MVAVLGVLGPGLVSGFADNDAGGITTYSLAGARFGYSLLWVILASQVVLFFTQEVGARLGLATGKGLMGLIRERWGVRWAAFAAAMMLLANLGSTVAEFAGIGSALSLFGIPPQISAAVAAVVVVSLITLGSYSRIQYLFVAIGLFVSIAYVISANIAHPAWDVAFHSLIVPQLQASPAYWLMVVGTVGTTITPWGQAFIQSYVADKGLRSEDLPASRLDVFAGALLTNVIAAFILIAVAATLWTSGQRPVCGRPARCVVPGSRCRPALQRLHDLRSLRLGDRRQLELARGAGILWSARLLHWVRGVVRDDPGPATDPGDVLGAGLERDPPAVHSGLRHAPRSRPQDAGAARQRADPVDHRLAVDGSPCGSLGDPRGHEHRRRSVAPCRA